MLLHSSVHEENTHNKNYSSQGSVHHDQAVAFRQSKQSHPTRPHSRERSSLQQSKKLIISQMQYYSVKFTELSGDILDLISEYILQKSEMHVPPVFVMTNSIMMRNYCDYKRENYAIQIEILIDQIGELKRELFEYFDQKLFKMSKNLSIIYHSNIASKEWSVLEELSHERHLSKDD